MPPSHLRIPGLPLLTCRHGSPRRMRRSCLLACVERQAVLTGKAASVILSTRPCMHYTTYTKSGAPDFRDTAYFALFVCQGIHSTVPAIVATPLRPRVQ
jgi:hypothetical protein